MLKNAGADERLIDPQTWKDLIARNLEVVKSKNSAFDALMKSIVENIDLNVLNILHKVGKISVQQWDKDKSTRDYRSKPERPEILDAEFNLQEPLSAEEANELIEYVSELDAEHQRVVESLMTIHQMLVAAKQAIKETMDQRDEILWRNLFKGHLGDIAPID